MSHLSQYLDPSASNVKVLSGEVTDFGDGGGGVWFSSILMVIWGSTMVMEGDSDVACSNSGSCGLESSSGSFLILKKREEERVRWDFPWKRGLEQTYVDISCKSSSCKDSPLQIRGSPPSPMRGEVELMGPWELCNNFVWRAYKTEDFCYSTVFTGILTTGSTLLTTLPL